MVQDLLLCNHEMSLTVRAPATEIATLVRRHAAIYRHNERYMARHSGIPVAELRCLMEFTSKAEFTVKELTERLELSHSRLSRILNRLEDGGMLRRRIHPGNRRCVLARITPKGLVLLRSLEDQLVGIYEPALQKISTERSETAVQVLRQMLGSLLQRFGDPRKEGSQSDARPEDRAAEAGTGERD